MNEPQVDQYYVLTHHSEYRSHWEHLALVIMGIHYRIQPVVEKQFGGHGLAQTGMMVSEQELGVTYGHGLEEI